MLSNVGREGITEWRYTNFAPKFKTWSLESITTLNCAIVQVQTILFCSFWWNFNEIIATKRHFHSFSILTDNLRIDSFVWIRFFFSRQGMEFCQKRSVSFPNGVLERKATSSKYAVITLSFKSFPKLTFIGQMVVRLQGTVKGRLQGKIWFFS